MSLVGKVGRRRLRARLAMVLLYAILSLGALTTLYPFLLMVSTSFKGPTDQNDNRMVPKYFSDDGELYAKYLDDKYKGDKGLIESTRLGGDASPGEVEAYGEFLNRLPLDLWTPAFTQAPNQVTSRLKSTYQAWLRAKYHSIAAVNKAYTEENTDFQTIDPPAEQLDRKAWQPAEGLKYKEWLQFKAALPAEFRMPVRTERIFQNWLKNKYQGQLDQIPKDVVGTAKTIDQIRLPTQGPVLADFVRNGLPNRYASTSVERLWAAVSPREMPIEAFDRSNLQRTAPAVRREFAARNFGYVLDYILLNGRAIWNTFLFCLLAVATQLTVNPIAAYALSRYPIRASAQILIFLLATMAFPAEVALIPSFLLLKSLGLLNTFAALVLPGAASGYMIFLLKGFFDSLPKELFEAGQIDGAKESTMMMRIALPLSKPVLGYLALLAFMGAYGAFIYAFLVVQDQKMWTLMVWIYQLQTIGAPKATIMAALTLAAIPTLAVFLFAQRFIMRGIVLPGER